MASRTPNPKSINKKQITQSNVCNNNKDTQKSLGLASISYADYVILASTLAYAISEELSDEDIQMLLAFLGMVSSNLILLGEQKAILESASNQSDQDEKSPEQSILVSDVLLSSLDRSDKSDKKKKRFIKKLKKRKLNKSKL